MLQRKEDTFEEKCSGAIIDIAIVDDDPGVLHGLTRLLSAHGWKVRPFASPRHLLKEIRVLSPSCVIADLAMPELSGLELQEMLAEHGCDCAIVFVTGHGDVRSSVRAMRAGAVDFLTKPFDAMELLDAVHRALRRNYDLREMRGSRARIDERVASLTQRERQVFEQVVAGYLNKQIAVNLGISEKTVKVHRARVMRKMSAKSAAALGRAAERVGIR